MNFKTINRSRAFDLLEDRAVLATSSRRLARHLISVHSQYQQDSRRLVWETPAIMPFSSWLEHLFFSKQVQEGPFLLGPHQEAVLWEEIISSNTPEYRILGLKGTSEAAARAYETVSRHKLPWMEINGSTDREIRTFVQWAQGFNRTCAENHFLAGADLPAYLARCLKKKLLTPPENLILAGFLEFDPAIEDFLTCLAENNCGLYLLPPPCGRGRARWTSYADLRDETMAAAAWALNLTLEDPEARVGIAVPGLEKMRTMIERSLDHAFHPETVHSLTQPDRRIFNISLGFPLGHYPLARCAALFLGLLNRQKWDIQELGIILDSPFLQGAEQEFAARAALDRKIRSKAHPWITAQKLLELAGREDTPHHCPDLTRILASSLETAAGSKEGQSPAAWAALFSRILSAAGWPGSRALNSIEFQTFQAFKEELSRLSSLEPVMKSISYGQALKRFEDLLSSRIFQPESVKARVQVMGLLETPGLDFDHLWVMNLNADVLPASSRPNPFLPVELQRKYRTPGSSPARELELARRIMDSLLSSSRDIIFSHSTHEDDRSLLASPLLSGLQAVDPKSVILHQPAGVFTLMAGCGELVPVKDGQGLALEDSRLLGGSRAFQDQALCPFRGYAAHRLGSGPLEEPLFALTPMDRGSLTHRALMRVWQEIGSLEELREMISQDSLDSLVDETCSLTVQEFQTRGHVLFSPEFMELEKARLKRTIFSWLQRELGRKEFEVSALEETRNVQIGGISIKTRMDRLDLLEDGRLVIIDYKTGAAVDSVENMWMGERIIEPQLPIYSLVTGHETAGVVLAQVHPRNCRFHGIISSDEISLQGNTLKTPEKMNSGKMVDILKQWRRNLEAISLEIQNGYALINPLPQSGDKTCRYCGFKALCRIMEKEG